MAEEINKRLAKFKTEKKEFPGEGKVIVKAKAFQKMVMHVLRFGSNGLPQNDWAEVMGMCIGKYQGDDVVVVDAVPISHGSHIEVAWSEMDYAIFADVDAQYGEQGLFSCGWYHSHPGLNVFFSKVDVRNQLGFQTEQNPKAFGIVFDHTLMDAESNNLGFKTFRLDNPSQGITSDYHEVETLVEPPNSLDFYRVPRNIVDYTHNKDKLFLSELSEESYGGAVETEEAVEEVIDPKSQLEPIVKGFGEGMTGFSQAFFDPFSEEFGGWTADIKKAATKGGKKLVETVEILNEGVEDGLSRVKSWFERNFDDKVAEHEKSVEEVVKEYEEKQSAVVQTIEQAINEVSQTIVGALKSTLATKVDAIKEAVISSLESISDFGEHVGRIKQGIEAQAEVIKKISESSKSTVAKIQEAGEKTVDELRNSVSLALKVPKDEVEDLYNQKQKLADSVKNLENKLKEIRDLF